MILPVSWTMVVIVTAIVLVAGATNGLAGFGFAVVGTMALATVIDPATAVVFMILPILAVNVSLVRDLSRRELRTCSQRFGPLIAAALVGTVVGMAVLDRLPEAPLRVGLGLLTLGFVATAQQRVPLPGWVSVGNSDLGKTPLAMVGIGGVSGALFGGTNVASSSSRISGVSTSRTACSSASSRWCFWDSASRGSLLPASSGSIPTRLSLERPFSQPCRPLPVSQSGSDSEPLSVTGSVEPPC